MNGSQLPTCPECGLSDHTFKVSVLYLESSALANHRPLPQTSQVERWLALVLAGETSPFFQAQAAAGLVKLLSPPEGEKRVTRRIHPDAMIGFLGLVFILIVFQAMRTQPGAVVYLCILVLVSLAVYLGLRRKILKRYEEKKLREERDVARIEDAVSKWMRLYCCGRDQVVFDPAGKRFVPMQDMHLILFSEEP